MRILSIGLAVWGLCAGFAAAQPSVRVLESTAVPGVDYCGSEVSFVLAFENMGAQKIADVHASFKVNGKTYEATPTERDDGTCRVIFSIDSTGEAAVVAGRCYPGTLNVRVDSTPLLTDVPFQLKQGTVMLQPKSWFNDPKNGEWTDGVLERLSDDLETGLSYTPRDGMPSAAPVVIESSVRFDTISDPDEYWPGEVQCAVRIAGGETAPRFQVFAAAREGDGWRIGWHDANGSEGAVPVPEKGVTYSLKLEVTYRAAASDEPDALVCWVKTECGYQKFFTGALVNSNGGVGGADHCSGIGLSGDGDITAAVGSYTAESLNANLVRMSGDEYATVADAVAEGGDSVRDGTLKLELLHDATWMPEATVFNSPGAKYCFVHSDRLHLDLSNQTIGYLIGWQHESAWDRLVYEVNRIAIDRLRRSASCDDDLLKTLLKEYDGSPEEILSVTDMTPAEMEARWKAGYAGVFLVDSRAAFLTLLKMDNRAGGDYRDSGWLDATKLPGASAVENVRMALKLQGFDDIRAGIVADSGAYDVLRKWSDGRNLAPEVCASKPTVLVSAAVGAKEILNEGDIVYTSAACENGTMILRTKLGDGFGEEVSEDLLKAAFGLVGSARLNDVFAADAVALQTLNVVDKTKGVVEVQARPANPSDAFFFKTTVR